MHYCTGGWCIFEVSCDLMELPRQQGNRGLVATTYIQDGLHAESFWRHHEVRHKLWYEHSCTIENEVWLLQQMDLVFGIECKLHIGARAVKWGQRRMITEGLLDEVHCGIKSLISCSTALREHIPSFLHRVVAYDADRNRWPEQQQRWSSLGVGAEIMETFEEVNPIWNRMSKTLHVDVSLMRNPDGMKKIEAALMHSFSWKGFMMSRFGGVGKSARMWLLSVMLGLDEVFAQVLRGTTVSKYYLNNYTKLGDEGRRVLCVAAFGHAPVEGILLELLEDDRFYKKFQRLWPGAVNTVREVAELPLDFFRDIVTAVGLPSSGELLKHDVILTMHTGNGFFFREACHEMYEYPMCLTQGNISDNVTRFG